MLGKPKFKKGDKVKVKTEYYDMIGVIDIIDKYGCFEDDSDVCYDILGCDEKYITEQNPNGECLYKHINEKFVSGYEK